MKQLLAIISLILLISCNGQPENNKSKQISTVKYDSSPIKEKITTDCFDSNNLDSVRIVCLMAGKYQDHSFVIHLSKDSFEVTDFHLEDNKIKILSAEKKN